MNDLSASTTRFFFQMPEAWRRPRQPKTGIATIAVARLRGSIAVLCAVLMLNLAAGAQTNNATLSGTVRDNTGGVVPNVAITLSSAVTGLKRQATTNGEG